MSMFEYESMRKLVERTTGKKFKVRLVSSAKFKVRLVKRNPKFSSIFEEKKRKERM